MLADHRLSDISGIAFLARVQPLHPTAKRALLVSAADAWGADPAATRDFVRAVALGEIDAFIQKPVVEPDEQFHLAIAEFLEDWARTHRPRFALIQIVGDRWSEMSHNFRDHLARVSLPFDFYTPESPEGRALLERAGRAGPLPIAILHDGRIFVRPSAVEIVAALGLDPSGQRPTFDVAIVGGGPAGLAAAVNAASEGLSVAVVEGEVVGGQAGTTSLVRNYLGFPHGVSGADLAHRAFMQARSFGAQFLIARVVTGLRTEGDTHVLTLEDGSAVAARAVVLAMGSPTGGWRYRVSMLCSAAGSTTARPRLRRLDSGARTCSSWAERIRPGKPPSTSPASWPTSSLLLAGRRWPLACPTTSCASSRSTRT